MSDTRITVNLGDREIILIGTAHVSKESIEEVSRVIHGEAPSVSGSLPGDPPPDQVCVELDAARYTSMTQKENWEKLDVVKVFREGKGFFLMANLVLSGFQRRMGKELGVQPGEEMKTAVETAETMGIPYAFCDREVQITLRRAWARCGFWSKCKLLASLLSSAFTTEKLSETEIENLKNRSELDGMMTELAEYLPSVKETLIDERDRYLAAKIWVSAAQASVPVRRQVAVVGAGHLQGIKAHLEWIASGEESEDVAYLDQIPPPSFFSKAAGWIFPALILAIIAAGFFRAGADMSLVMVLRWILWNGSLAAAGTLLALGHPLSILVSFIGAPFATLNPVLGIGLFSGITEASMRKPRVVDAETIIDDISSLRGVYRNRITKALLVFFLSSIGGAIGNFISIPSLAELLIK